MSKQRITIPHAPPRVQQNITRRDIAAQVARKHPDLPTRQIAEIVGDTLDALSVFVGREDRVEIRGLGVFKRSQYQRECRNPRTGESVGTMGIGYVRFKQSSWMADRWPVPSV